jgi:hypothetical protein
MNSTLRACEDGHGARRRGTGAKQAARTLADVLLSDGKTHKSAEAMTNPAGQFSAMVNLLDDHVDDRVSNVCS